MTKDELLKKVFQYRKRYEVTCDDSGKIAYLILNGGFNTASGMRSHVTPD